MVSTFFHISSDPRGEAARRIVRLPWVTGVGLGLGLGLGVRLHVTCKTKTHKNKRKTLSKTYVTFLVLKLVCLGWWDRWSHLITRTPARTVKTWSENKLRPEGEKKNVKHDQKTRLKSTAREIMGPPHSSVPLSLFLSFLLAFIRTRVRIHVLFLFLSK